jgi:hypothetical protein
VCYANDFGVRTLEREKHVSGNSVTPTVNDIPGECGREQRNCRCIGDFVFKNISTHG